MSRDRKIVNVRPENYYNVSDIIDNPQMALKQSTMLIGGILGQAVYDIFMDEFKNPHYLPISLLSSGCITLGVIYALNIFNKDTFQESNHYAYDSMRFLYDYLMNNAYHTDRTEPTEMIGHTISLDINFNE